MNTEKAERGVQLGKRALSGLAACAIAWTMSAPTSALWSQSAAPAAQNPAPAATAPATPAASTDIVGIWQGTLHIAQANKDLRSEIRIAKDNKGVLKATLYSIDQGGQPIAASKTTFENGTLTFSIDMIGARYEGKMSADGKIITGTLTQGPAPMALNLERTTPDAAWPIPEPLKPMAADANPSFEVATIKPNNSGATQMQGLVIRGRQFLTRASSFDDLIGFAYNVQIKQVVGGEPWMSTDRYDIEAVPDAEGVPNTEQIRIMIRKLLTDRFKLTFHREQREMSAYVIEVGKAGPKLTANESKGNLPGLGFQPAPDGITLRVMNATMADFAGFLQIVILDRPVVDRTSLAGRYDFKCTFTPDDSQFNGHPPRMPAAPGADGSTAADTAAAPSLYEAVQQQLGLKLTAEKTNVDVIAIDHVEKPSPN